MRSMLRSLLVSVLGVVLAGASLAGISPAAQRPGGTPSPEGAALAGPLVISSLDELLGGQQSQAARTARRSAPDAVAQRQAARFGLEDLSPAAAAGAVRSAFPELIEQPAGGVPKLASGAHIVHYATDHAAQVALPGGKGVGVIESLAPIAKKTARGGHVPLDLRLRSAGAHFQPVRATVGVDVPRRLADGVSLSTLGVSLTPITRDGLPLPASAGAPQGASVLWGAGKRAQGGDRDLSTIAKALPEGFDLSTLLLSANAPSDLYFRVGMPSGARLKRAANGSTQIIGAKGSTLATISPVSAEDAEGSSVPASMSVHGKILHVSVNVAGDYLYPIAVDPEINDSQLAKTTAGKRSNWEFFTSNAGRFQGTATYEGPGAERLESKGIAEYAPAEWAYWGYQTHGVSHIYEIKTETSAHNKLAKIESFLEFLEPGGTRETKKMLSNEAENPEYEKKATTACAANASKVEECLPGSGKAKNSVHFQQSATGSPGANYKFSDTMSQGIVSIAEPTGTHSTTSYNTTSPTFEFEAEIEGKKEKVSRANALYGTGSWMTKSLGALKLQSADTGIGVSKAKLEYESAPGTWTQLYEHNYLEVENACQGVQCYESHSEYTTLPTLLPDGEQKLRYRAEEAISGTQSLESEGQATVKVDTQKPHNIHINGLPFGGELSEKPYELTVEATDGEGSTIASSGIKSIALFIDGHEVGTPVGSCAVAKGACTASRKSTVNGAELGSGKHDISVVALDNAGNEKQAYEPVSIHHSTPVSLGPGSVDLQSGDFALSATDVSLGSGLTVSRNYSSRAPFAGATGPLGLQWNLSVASAETLVEILNGSVLMTAADGKQSIFAPRGEGKFEPPNGDANLELSLEENPSTKQKLAYYLKDSGAHTSVKFTKPANSTTWVPNKQEGTVENHTVKYGYQAAEQYLEYDMPSGSQPQQMVTGSDGNLWYPTYETEKIVKLTPTGLRTEYPSGQTHTNIIAAGPDGNLWYANASYGALSKMTPSGVVTSYRMSSEGTLKSIVAGPDGNVWFIRQLGGWVYKVGKVTPGGTVSEYSLPSESQPWGISAGPDGNIWLTDNQRNKILRMTTAGTITGEYSLPAGSGPFQITAGHDGNLWFTEPTAKKIGKISTSGVLAEYSTPTIKATYALTAGPDGNVWFAGDNIWWNTVVGKITPSGTESEYDIANVKPKGLTVGSDGNIWFSGESPAKVGMVPISGLNIRPTKVLAPKPAGVSCEFGEMKPGCRALKFQYASETTATGEYETQWGQFKSMLTKVTLTAYDPSSESMEETAVAEYTYDNRGRLRAEWDPRISPSLKTLYGYDDEGHLTVLSPPGQEPWAFTYGSSAGDAGMGRLMKTTRAPASAEPWNGYAEVNWARPNITGTLAEGVKLAASTGTWAYGTFSYGYQWKDCDSSGEACKPIGGATNPNYTLTSSDVGHTITVAVTATSGGDSATAESYASAVVKASGDKPFTEYAVPDASEPFGISGGPDGNVWFTSRVGKVSKITTAGAITEYSSGGHGPRGITTGPDGNMWLVEDLEKRVNKMTTSGSLTEYLGGTFEPHNYGIAAGPDGKLWFTESTQHRIGKMTTGGVATDYVVPGYGWPLGITVGPDGNMWFADSGAGSGYIGKITTSGTVTEYALPEGSDARGITAGLDGNLWFTSPSSGKIGKITTSGAITQYTLPFGSEPYGLTTGPFGNMWFMDRHRAKIGKITVSGVVTEYGLGSTREPLLVAAGPDGNVWFTDAKASKVVKIALGGGPSTEGAAVAPQPGTTLEYNVPVTGAGAPHDMSVPAVAKWGQKDLPEEATAIIPEDEAQGWPASSYKRATVYYLDEQGRTVNIAAPSNATYGSIATAEYNEYNDVVRTLSPDNRETALKAGASSVEQSKLLDAQSTFNGEGAKEGEVEEPGTMLVESLGPQHQVKYTAGGETKESLAREHKKYFYDQGAPGGEKYRLVTETADLAQLANHEEVEVRQTRMSYSGQSNLGWKLRAPTSVTVDPEGLKLTSTTEYNPTTGQITETRDAGADKTFSYATKFGETGTEAGKLKAPSGVAVNSEGKLWVVDSANNRVEKFGAEGAYISKFGEVGSGPGQLKEPQGIAIDSAGHLWVADTGNNRIEEFSSSGTYMATVGSLGSEPGQFKAPSAIAFGASGNMWVADSANNRIEKFDKEAKYVSQFGSLGSEPGQLKEPKAIAIDASENIWVADTANNRIQEYTKGGSYTRRFGTAGSGEGQLNTPIDLKIDSAGNIWTVDAANNRAESFSPSGSYITQLGFKGTEAGQLTGPRALAFDASGKLWVTDSSNNRLEQWSKGADAHDHKVIYYSAEANTEGFSSCGSRPEWAGLICETLPAKQPELMSLPKLPVTTYTYNMYNEPETVTETFGGSTTRTKKFTYDEAGRRKTSQTTATTGASLPKITFTYNSEQGVLEKQSAEGGGTITSQFNRLGQITSYTDADSNVAKYTYFGLGNGYQLKEVSDSSNAGVSKQTYGYDETTKLRSEVTDSSAGTFKATYDAEGNVAQVEYPLEYPNDICERYTRNSVDEVTKINYAQKASFCLNEGSSLYSDTKVPSIHGNMLSQSSTLGDETYAYDVAGRLTETHETPEGAGCTVRTYAYDEEANRASSATRAPGGGGACQSEGGTSEGHNYDEANRLADGGMSYDALGNILTLPAADAEGHELTSTFYVDNAVASQSQNGVTNNYYLDPEGRTRETVTGTKTVYSHYDSPGQAVAWTAEGANWTRNIAGIDGTLLATQKNGETPILQLHDLQGNVAATIGDKNGETKLLSTYNSTEFGVPNAGKEPPKFAWLGAAGVASSLSSGVVTYGSTSYVPQTARALQSEAVEAPGLPGGSGAGAAYTVQEEPWNMQGAAAAGAEAPGLEAAREQAAFNAAITDPWVEHRMNRSRAADLARNYFEAESVAVVLEMFDLPADFLELAGKLAGEFMAEFEDAYKWLDDAGNKLRKCAQNQRKYNGRDVNMCSFSYDQDEWEPEFPPFTGIHPIGKVTWPNFTVEPMVNECIYIQGPSYVCVANVYIKTEL